MMGFKWKIKLVIFYACAKSMLTMYILEHSGMPHLCIYLVFITQFIGYQHNFICFVYWWFFQLKVLLVTQCQNFINFGHLKSIFIILRNEFAEEGCTVIVSWLLDFKGAYSQMSISIEIWTLAHCYMLSFHYSLCTKCSWLNQRKQFIQEKLQVSSMLPLSCTI